MVKRFDVVGLGYTALDYLGVIPHFPEENRKLELRRFIVQGGGPTATAVVTARRLGLTASYIGKVGDDEFGKRMLDELARERVDLSSVLVEPGASSQFAFIMVDEQTSERTILWTRGSVSRIKPEEVDCDLVASAGVLLIDDLEPEAAVTAARIAREERIPIVMDAGSLRSGVKELLPLCDYIVASEVFAEQISGGKGVEDSLRAIFSFDPRAAVVTLGEQGCAALSDEGMIEVEGFEVTSVDTTGAGDVFHGAFLFAVLQGWDLYRACVFSNAAAAMKCRRLGGRAGIPNVEEVFKFLGRARPDIGFRLRANP
ncbi:MAG: sugar kinase [Candidatus Krumholzibacteria bacterium]|nr:sugar kinase [Candidatus Krumholzibacteria bacterium]